ncbi:MAG: acyl carrier protein [Alphaproteobacteria bacterium]|nr:acyl carrier protein [Alphaproteobacteria bacterium]
MVLTERKIMDFLADELDVDTDGLSADDELFSSGLIDSFSMVSLMAFLEDSEGIQMNSMDVNLNNLDTVNRILAYLAKVT